VVSILFVIVSVVYAAVNCGKCKKSIPDNVKFCPECGAKVDSKVVPSGKEAGASPKGTISQREKEAKINNLIVNSGFEEGQEGWSMASWEINDTEGRTKPKCAVLDYNGNSVTLKQKNLEITPDKYYKMSIWSRSEIDNKEYKRGLVLLAEGSGEKPIFQHTDFSTFPFWTQLVHYFYSKEFDKTSLRFYAQAYKPGKIYLDDAELVELTDKQLKENLLVNPDFEDGEETFPCGWEKQMFGSDRPMKVTIDTSAGFIRGDKSVRIESLSEKGAGIYSVEIPAVAGKDYVMSVWLKAKEDDTAVQLVIDGWMIGFPHWYKQIVHKVTKEWRKYTLDVHVPGEGEDNYLAGRLVNIRWDVRGVGTIWADEVRFVQE
jgi:hypothetical protein